MHSERLERLHLNMCSGVRDEEFQSMKCMQLRSISLHIPSNSHMRAVQMEAATLTDASLGVLAQRCVELEEASFTFVEGGVPLYASVSVAGILAMVQWCLSLRVLTLDSVYPFTDSCMQAGTSYSHSPSLSIVSPPALWNQSLAAKSPSLSIVSPLVLWELISCCYVSISLICFLTFTLEVSCCNFLLRVS